MSSTYYEVHRAQLDAELEVASKAGDIPRMRIALAGLTSLKRAMFGTPEQRA